MGCGSSSAAAGVGAKELAGWRGKVDDTLEYWYGRTWKELTDKADPTPEATKRWYAGGEEIDNDIRARFKDAVVSAAGELTVVDGKVSVPPALAVELKANPERAVAMMVFFDQLTRNIFRGSTAMFGYDGHSVAVVSLFFDDGSYRNLPPITQITMSTVFMHSEDRVYNPRCMVICKAIEEDPSSTEAMVKKAKGTAEFGESHNKVVEQFGRYPHRNEFLGRETTPAEEEFLKTEAPKHGWMKIMKKPE